MREIFVEPFIRAAQQAELQTGHRITVTVQVDAEIFDRLEAEMTPSFFRQSPTGPRSIALHGGVILQSGPPLAEKIARREVRQHADDKAILVRAVLESADTPQGTTVVGDEVCFPDGTRRNLWDVAK